MPSFQRVRFSDASCATPMPRSAASDAAMSTTITIVDEHLGQPGGSAREVVRALRLAASKASAAEIIAARVHAEHEDRMKAERQAAHEPSPAPRTRTELLAGLRADPLRAHPAARDAESAVAEALEAFRRQRFFFLWDGVQVTDPDRMLLLADGAEAVFVRLFPMQAG